MTCKEWKNEWVASLYGELDSGENRRLEAHLERCAECRTTLDQLSASRRLLQQAVPAVPATPRVVVLRPGLAWRPVWSFAAGAACALVLFSLGVIAAPRLLSAPDEAGITESAASALEEVERRLALIETGQEEDEPALTASQLERALDLFEQKIHRTRAQDLDYMMKSITASEMRTGTWIDQTYDALNLLALRQDPRFSER